MLSIAGSIGGIFSCIARLVFGNLIDKYGFKYLFKWLLCIQICNIICAYYFVCFTPIYFCSVLANNFCIGATFVTIPTSIAKVFGTKYGTTVYTCVLFGSLASSFFNILNAKYFLLQQGFFFSFFECLIAQVVSFLLV
jgi:MFS family permease